MMVSTSTILGVLLSGGRSRRMGHRPKSLAPLAGRPLLSYAIDRLRPQVAALVVNANEMPGRFAQFDLPVVADTVAGFAGPLAGILAGMTWARAHMPETPFIATVATDTPFFPRDLVTRLAAALDAEHEVAVARCAGRNYPVFGVFPVALGDALEAFLRDSGNRAVMAWLDSRRTAFVEFAAEAESRCDPFFNVNTPADLAAAEAALRSTSARPPARGGP